MGVLALYLLGICVGLIGALFGLGGGFVMIPALVLGFKVPMHDAVALSLTAIVATSAVVSMLKLRDGLVNIRLATVLDLATAVGAAAGAALAVRLSQAALKLLFSVLVAVSGAAMLRKGVARLRHRAAGLPVCLLSPDGGEFSGSYSDPGIPGGECRYGVKNVPAAAVGSLFAGGISGLLGIGGGIVTVPLTNIICRMPIKAASATSNFMIGVTAGASAMVYYHNGGMHPELAAPLILGVMSGAALGMRCIMRCRDEFLQIGFGLLMFIISARMYISAAHG